MNDKIVPGEAQREPLADICPSCGSTDKNERAVCANQWHAVPSEVAPSREQRIASLVTQQIIYLGALEDDNHLTEYGKGEIAAYKRVRAELEGK